MKTITTYRAVVRTIEESFSFDAYWIVKYRTCPEKGFACFNRKSNAEEFMIDWSRNRGHKIEELELIEVV